MQKYIILGHENPDVDSIVSGAIYENFLKRQGYDAEFIIPDATIDQENIDICSNFDLDPTTYKKKLEYDENTRFILVDHNKRKNIGEIVEIIDHHPTEDKPIIRNTLNIPASSTSCILVQGDEKFYTAKEIELACLAAMVDTASFNSTKGTKEDKLWVEQMCRKYGFDYEKLYKIGLCLTNIDDLEKASLNGLKKYSYNGYQVESSYIQIDNLEENKNKITELLKILGTYTIDNNLAMFVFIVHDMDEFKTSTYKIDQNGFTRQDYDQYTARGSTIMPEIEAHFKKQEPQKVKNKTSE